MTPERWQRIKDLLYQAQQLRLEERSAFLDRSCSPDQALRDEVETLLSSSDEARSSFLENSPVQVTLMPGTKLGDYEVQKLLGSGAMGEVYRARDLRLRRDVAIKVLPSFVSSNKERLRRFEQEAQAAAALNHPNILAVFQMGTFQGAPYLVSELLEGETLRGHVKRGLLPTRKTIDYGVQIAHGLAAAHKKGIVHRDLKPENLFVTRDGRIKILDFGLAKLRQPELNRTLSASTAGDGATEPGTVMGTVGYMSPELVRGLDVDHRSDIFSFGTVLYEMLTGQRAFQGPTAADTMSAILNEDPPPVFQVAPSAPPALQRTVQRCLEKPPEQRFQSADDLVFALELVSDNLLFFPNRATGRTWTLERWIWVGITVLSMVIVLIMSFRISSLHLHNVQAVDTTTTGRDTGPELTKNELELLSSGFTQELNLFETGWGDIPRSDRRYAIVFDGSVARYINWDLHLKFTKPERDVLFGIKAIYTKSGDIQIAIQNQTCQTEGGGLEAWCSYGWGGKNPGGWDPGDYKVELYMAGTKIAEKKFRVT